MHAELEPATYGFTEADLDRPIFIDRVFGVETAPIGRSCDPAPHVLPTIGVEFMHITSPAQKSWIQDRIEGDEKDIRFTEMGKKAILEQAHRGRDVRGVLPGEVHRHQALRLDGGEALIPALEQIIKRGGQLGVSEIVMGMAHRGRLNVLANILRKPYGRSSASSRTALSPRRSTATATSSTTSASPPTARHTAHNVHLSLTPNPSHLEAVDPVVEGTRARQAGQLMQRQATATQGMPDPDPRRRRLRRPGPGRRDASNLSRARRLPHRRHHPHRRQQPDRLHHAPATTPARRRYCTDVAKMIEAPIFHVNGDDPEAVVYVAELAIDFRQTFQQDVVIDMFCYRRHGHNEGDEPVFTQPGDVQARSRRTRPSSRSIPSN